MTRRAANERVAIQIRVATYIRRAARCFYFRTGDPLPLPFRLLPVSAPSPSSNGTPAPPQGAAWKRELRADGSPDALPLIRQAVVEAAEACGFGEEDVAKIEMAVGEACTNIIEHAYNTHPTKLEIAVYLTRFPNRLEVTIQDYSSINFAVDEADTVDGIEDWIAAGKRRGLGIFIIQSFVDKVQHRFVCGQGNELVLIKYFA